MKFLITAFILLLSLHFSAQQDYTWLKINRYKVATLSDELKETSGLNFLDGKLYTFNDGGNTSELFQIDPKTGKIIARIGTDLNNSDWEALTSDENNFYLADTGNNYGNRKDLKIYKIQADSLQHGKAINFRYPEQLDYGQKPHSNNWDAESLIFNNGNLHLFTKEWQRSGTTHYKITTKISEEMQDAEKLETYDLGYLATDASYFAGKLYIIGYTKKLEVYLTVFTEDENGLFFSKKAQKYYLGQTSKLGQIEGIAANEDGIYISAEEFDLKIFRAPQSLYFIPWKAFTFD